MKLLLKLDPRTTTNELHRGMIILKVSDIYKSNVLNFVNEILSGRCPEPFRCYFQYRRETYDMRRKHQLNVPSTRICLGDKAVRVYEASLWNDTSNIMAKYHFKKCYRKQLKKIYISNYTVDKNTCVSNYSRIIKLTRARFRSLPVGPALAAADHVNGCQLDELRLTWLPPAMFHHWSRKLLCVTCDM